MQGDRKKLYILCGLAGKGEDDIRNALAEKAEEAGYEAVCVSRYRKEGIRQYIAEHPEFRTVLLQESMQSSYPYTADELASLMDNYNLNIIVSLSKSHRANLYMKILYTAGILNALFEEDASAENIMNLILYPRTRKDCREYYRITNTADALEALDIVDEQKLQGILEYIEESDTDDEIRKKYRYVAKTLKIIENIYLARHLSEHVKTILSIEDDFQKYSAQKKKRWQLFTGKRKPRREQPPEGQGKPAPQPMQAEMPDSWEEDGDSVDEMVDEDISDLLGFGSGEHVFETRELYPADEIYGHRESETVDQEKKKNRWEKKIPTLRILAYLGVLVFLAGVILFGFFLFAEYQASKEETAPVVSQATGSGDEDAQDGTAKQGVILRRDEKPEQSSGQETEEDDGAVQEEIAEDTSVNRAKKQDSGTEKPRDEASGQDPAEEAVQTERAGTGNGAAIPQQDPVSISVSAANPEPAPPREEEKQEQVSYVGKILTGSEVAAAAAEEEEKGAALYLKTREDGEGYFSASVIAGMVDSSCSYLVEGSDGVHISFIQQ